MKTIIAMPAFNVERTLEQTVNELPEGMRAMILLGNNCSQDATAEVADRLGLQVMTHARNYGYGGNLKRLYREALRQGADTVVELHPDYQYDPWVVDHLIAYIEHGDFDVIQANRIRSRKESLAGGMPLYRHVGNRILTVFVNLWFGVNFGEWHSGMRAYHRDVLEALPLESYPDSHSFSADILMDCVARGFRVAELPVPVRYEERSSSLSVRGLFAYAFHVFGAVLRRPPWKRAPYGSPRAPDPDRDQTVSTLGV